MLRGEYVRIRKPNADVVLPNSPPCLDAHTAPQNCQVAVVAVIAHPNNGFETNYSEHAYTGTTGRNTKRARGDVESGLV